MIAFGMDIQDPATWRDMILLGTAAASGWALVPLFVAGRVLGKWTGVVAARELRRP